MTEFCRSFWFEGSNNWHLKIVLYDPLGTTVQIAQEDDTWTVVTIDPGSNPEYDNIIFQHTLFLASMPGEYTVTQQ